MTPAPLTGAKILLTGVTGQVAGPLARNLVAAGNTVYGTSRFADADSRAKVEADGVIPVAIDLETASFDEIPDGLDYVINMAVAKSNNFDRDLAANAEGVALLIERVKGVKAFFHCSSCAVYEPNGHVSHVLCLVSLKFRGNKRHQIRELQGQQTHGRGYRDLFWLV
jgi:nucleoside-diphosphate-sugar epimerase